MMKRGLTAWGFSLGLCSTVACTQPRTVEPVLGYLPNATAFDLGRACPDTAPTTSAPISPSDSLARLPLGPFADDNVRGAWLARRAPGGWGGAFLQRPGRDPAFYLKRPQARDSLLAALVMWPEANVWPQGLANATVLQARWDFAELYDWWIYLQRDLGGRYGLISWDIQEARNRLELGVDQREPQQVARIAQRLRELQVPCHLVFYRLMSVAVAT